MIDPPQWIVPAGNIDSIRLACINWCCNGIANARIITSASGEYLCDIVRAQHGDTALFVNCSMVTHCLNEALDKFAKFCGQSKRNVLFYNVTDAVAKQIELSRGDRVSTQDDGTKVVEWSAQANCFRQVAAKTSRIARADQNFINKAIRGCFRAASPSKRMESTPLLCNGTFDAGVIIHDAVCFAKLMAIAGERAAAWAQSVSPGGMYDVRIVSVSMRASPIAVTLHELSDLGSGVEIVDHFGPHARWLNPADAGLPFPGTPYIFVGDFLVGGTELKLAEFYCNLVGSRICAAFVLGSALAAAEYKRPFPIFALASLKKAYPQHKLGFYSI